MQLVLVPCIIGGDEIVVAQSCTADPRSPWLLPRFELPSDKYDTRAHISRLALNRIGIRIPCEDWTFFSSVSEETNGSGRKILKVRRAVVPRVLLDQVYEKHSGFNYAFIHLEKGRRQFNEFDARILHMMRA